MFIIKVENVFFFLYSCLTEPKTYAFSSLSAFRCYGTLIVKQRQQNQ